MERGYEDAAVVGFVNAIGVVLGPPRQRSLHREGDREEVSAWVRFYDGEAMSGEDSGSAG